MKWSEWVMWGIIWFLIIVTCTSFTYAKEVSFTLTAPCVESDSVCNPQLTSLTDLDHIDVEGFLVPGGSWATSSHLGTIPATGRECDTLSFSLQLADSVCYAMVTTYAVDHSSNRSCMGSQYLLASPAPAPMSSPGLIGTYYDNRDFLPPVFTTRTDSMLAWDWNYDAPLPGMGVETFSMRWTGGIAIATGGSYRFRFQVEDGFSFTIGGVERIYDLGIQEEHSVSWTGTMPSDTVVPVTVEYMANNGDAIFQAYWTPPGSVETLIPASAWRH